VPYSTLWNATNVRGNHTLKAVLRDKAGKQVASAPVRVIVVSNKLSTTSLDGSLNYALSDQGAEFLGTTDASAPMTTGYAQVQMDPGTEAPGGHAVLSYHSNGVLVSQTTVPISRPTPSGRIYVDVKGGMNAGVAFANPNSSDAVIAFHFTDVA